MSHRRRRAAARQRPHGRVDRAGPRRPAADGRARRAGRRSSADEHPCLHPSCTGSRHYGAAALSVLLFLGVFGLPVPGRNAADVRRRPGAQGGICISLQRLHRRRRSAAWAASPSATPIGRTFGLGVVDRFGKWLHVTRADLARVEGWFEHSGRWLLTFGYFIPGVRHFTAIVAGSSRLPVAVFARFAYAGAALWTLTFMAFGWYIGPEWEEALEAAHRHLILVTVVAAHSAARCYPASRPTAGGLRAPRLIRLIAGWHVFRARARGSPCSARRPRARSRARAPIARSFRGTCARSIRGPLRSTKPGIAAEHDRQVPHLHPALGAPAQELDVVGVEMLGPHDRGRAVVLLDAVVDDQVAPRGSPPSSACPDTASGAGCTASRRSAARTRGWPRSTPRVSSGLPTMMPPTTERPARCSALDRAGRVALPTLPPALALRVLRRGAQEREVLVEDVLDARGRRSGSPPAASAAPASRRGWRSTRSSPARCSGCR